MTDQRQPGVLGSLPSSRPHLRSAKRAGRAGVPAEAERAAVPAEGERAAVPAEAERANPASAEAGQAGRAPNAADRSSGPGDIPQRSEPTPAATRRAPQRSKPAAARRAPQRSKPTPAATRLAPQRSKPTPARRTASGGRRSSSAGPAPSTRSRPVTHHDPRPPAQTSVLRGPLATAVQAAAELTEIGLSAGARALRRALARLPRP